MNKKEILNKKFEDNTVLFPQMTAKELEELISKICLKENNKLYRRFAGHLHKQEDYLKELESNAEDLKIFLRSAIKNGN